MKLTAISLVIIAATMSSVMTLTGPVPFVFTLILIWLVVLLTYLLTRML